MNPKQNFRGPSTVETANAEDKEPVRAVANKEQEADRSVKGVAMPAVQKKSAEEEDTVQRKEKGRTKSEVSSGFQSAVHTTKGRGNNLDKGTQKSFGSKFGADFSNVKVHNSSKSHKMAAEVNARAFTVGQDIYFNKGEYQPETKSGKKLLAHELTHTLQNTNEASDNSIRKEEQNAPQKRPRSESCKEGEDITQLINELIDKGPGIIDRAGFPEEERARKQQVFMWVFQHEDDFLTAYTHFAACERIEIPELNDAIPNGGNEDHKNTSFSGYSAGLIREVGGLKSLKENAELFLNTGDMDALLEVLKLIGHEKRHITLEEFYGLQETDLNDNHNVENPIGVAKYLAEEILVKAEEMQIELYFRNGNYTPSTDLTMKINDYWGRIKRIVKPEKVEEIKLYIANHLRRNKSKDYGWVIPYGVLNSMDTGFWVIEQTEFMPPNYGQLQR